MFKILTVLNLIFLNFAHASSTMEIKKTIKTYFEGYQNADIALIQKAFHSDTRLLSVENGKLEKTEMKDWLVSLTERRNRGEVRIGDIKIYYIDVKEIEAIAKVELRFEKFISTDYLSFLFINGEWKIVGKIYYFENR
jgi:hypothetical protein